MRNYDSRVLQILNSHLLGCGVIASTDDHCSWFGDLDSLDCKSLPRQLFGGSEEIKSTFNYLAGNRQPKLLAQGRVQTVIGLVSDNIKYGFFWNSDQGPIEIYKLALLIHHEMSS